MITQYPQSNPKWSERNTSALIKVRSRTGIMCSMLWKHCMCEANNVSIGKTKESDFLFLMISLVCKRGFHLILSLVKLHSCAWSLRTNRRCSVWRWYNDSYALSESSSTGIWLNHPGHVNRRSVIRSTAYSPILSWTRHCWLLSWYSVMWSCFCNAFSFIFIFTRFV